MSFAGLAFIFHFMPIFLIIYYIVPVKHRGAALLVGSLVFYGIGNPWYLLLLIGSVLLNYLFASRIYYLKKKVSDSSSHLIREKIWLFVAVVYNIALLFTFKYYDTVVTGLMSMESFKRIIPWELPKLGLILPLGISFYTFQMLSFVIDVYTKKIKGRVSLYHFAIYATMFPQIGAGPIVRFVDINQSIIRPQPVKGKCLEKGIMLFTMGLSYKVLLADKLASLWTDVWRVGASGIDTLSAWFGAWGYSLEIYFDFWGYSLMAIGVGLMLGFNLPENFNEPYCAKTMTDFWRRWHITLGSWFRDYIYIPLGGSKRGRTRMVLAMFAVWIFTGIWHGASMNFIVWGLFLFFTMLIEKLCTYKWLQNSRIAGHIYMFIMIPVSWMIFNITNLKVLGEYLLRMIGVTTDMVENGITVSSIFTETVVFNIAGMNGMNMFLELISTYWWLFGLGVLFATPLPGKYIAKYEKTIWLKGPLFILFWVSIYELAVSGNNPFIYFSF